MGSRAAGARAGSRHAASRGRARRRRLVAAACLGLALAGALLAGCGGGERDEREQPPLSAAEYTEAVNAELIAFNSEFASLGEAAAGAGSAEEYLDAVRDLRGRVAATADALEAMRPPAEAEDVHTRLAAAFAELAGAYEAVVSAVEAGEEDEIRAAGAALERASRSFTREAQAIDRAARKAGLELEQLGGAA